MRNNLISERQYRECKITFFEQWDAHDFDGIYYSYVIADRQGNERFDQTDEYPLDNLEHANEKAIGSIDDDLDGWWIISCLAVNGNKHEHFPLSFHGEREGAIEVGMKELANRYPEWKHSVSVNESD